jgi:hypothetical protein
LEADGGGFQEGGLRTAQTGFGASVELEKLSNHATGVLVRECLPDVGIDQLQGGKISSFFAVSEVAHDGALILWGR